jgi:hypothetical protein
MAEAPGSADQIVFCIPIFNDWESASLLLTRIGAVVAQQKWNASVILVNDGSSEPCPALPRPDSGGLRSVEILHLRRNLGHQRAIAIGLTYIAMHRICRAVVVMDGDGEDAPEDLPKLWVQFQQYAGSRIVFAQRARRTEGAVFRIGYQLFKTLHWLLTGRKVEVGNFSIIPWTLLTQLVGTSEIWNHYAASVFKARLSTAQVPIARGNRLRSGSRMNFVSLVTHGLSAISVFGEEVGVRMILVAVVMGVVTSVAIAAIIVTRIFTSVAVPGWATNAAGFLAVALLNALMLSSMFSFLVLQARNGTSFLPLRDYEYYILGVTEPPFQTPPCPIPTPMSAKS